MPGRAMLLLYGKAGKKSEEEASIGHLQYLTEVCHNELSLVYRFSCLPVHHFAAPVSRLAVLNRRLGYVCRERTKDYTTFSASIK